MAKKRTKRTSGRSSDTFGQFGKKVDTFVSELTEARDRLQKEFKEQYDELKKSAAEAKKQVKDKKRWKEVESNLKQAAEELRKAFKAAFEKRR